MLDQTPAVNQCKCWAADPCPRGSWWVRVGDRMTLFLYNDFGRGELMFKHVEHVLDGFKNISR